jgi:hypothetical protein
MIFYVGVKVRTEFPDVSGRDDLSMRRGLQGCEGNAKAVIIFCDIVKGQG